MVDTHAQLLELSQTAEDVAQFLSKACALLHISYRQASLQAGLSHGAIWSIVSGKVKHGSPDTMAKLALFFKVPETSLLRLSGYTPRYMSPTRFLNEVDDVYHSLTDEEKEDWVRYGTLLIRARDSDRIIT